MSRFYTFNGGQSVDSAAPRDPMTTAEKCALVAVCLLSTFVSVGIILWAFAG